MGGNDASLERLMALWEQLQRLQPNTTEYKVLAEQIRAESDAYNALTQTKESPHQKPENSSRRSRG